MKSNLEWIRWGKEDPLWAVAAWKGKEKSGTDPWTDADFYAHGEAQWALCQKAWRRYGLSEQSCLEIGCGAGRITRWLAEGFQRVEGVDVSAEMLEYARRNIPARNLTLTLTEGDTLPSAAATVDAVFSTFVFQHLEYPADGLKLFSEIHRVLRPTGTAMIHLPIFGWPETSGKLDGIERGLLNAIHRGRAALSRATANYRRWRGRPVMRGTDYDAQWLRTGLDQIGFVDVEMFLQGPLGLPWVLARKPG
jgi:SAM-dependent methyltransferase